MRLYSGSTSQFIEHNVRNQMAEILRTAFFEHFRYNPGQAEVGAWRNSLRAFSQVLDHGGLKDHGIIVEYQRPLTSKRLDGLVRGRDASGSDQAVIVELKQWEKCAKERIHSRKRSIVLVKGGPGATGLKMLVPAVRFWPCPLCCSCSLLDLLSPIINAPASGNGSVFTQPVESPPSGALTPLNAKPSDPPVASSLNRVQR
jgi:hypothetical protein